MLGRNPVDCALDASPLACSRLGCRVVCTFDFNDIAFCVFDNFLALNDIGVFETNLSARFETEIFLRRLFHEVVSFNIDLTGERNLA